MRLGFGQDFGRRAGADELGEHLAAQEPRVLDLAVELAVGKGAGAALAELHVGFWIQNPPPPQAPGVLGPLAHDLAAVQDDRPESHLGENQPREQATRAGADHHWARSGGLRRPGDEAVAGVGRRLDAAVPGEARQHFGLVPQGDVHRIDHGDGRFPARVVGPAHHGEIDQVLRRRAEALQDGGRQRLRPVTERQLQFGQSQHGRVLARSEPRAPLLRASARSPRLLGPGLGDLPGADVTGVAAEPADHIVGDRRHFGVRVGGCERGHEGMTLRG